MASSAHPTTGLRRSRRPVRAAVAGAIVLAGIGVAGAAQAQSNDDAYVGASTTVLNTQISQDPAVAGVQETRSTDVSASELAFTGGDAMVVALIGGGLLVAGSSILLVRRHAVAV